MTVPTNTWLTANVIGNREDLSDVIYRISPTATPFLSMASKAKATNTIHEWQTQDLASAAVNAAAEGDDAAAKSVTPTVRLQTYTQIATKTAFVSNTQQAMNPAGRTDEMGYQMSLISLEVKRDMEYGMLTGYGSNQATGSAPRQTLPMGCWIRNNVDTGASWAAGTATGTEKLSLTATSNTDGTQVAFTEARLKNVLQKIFTAGGNPDKIFLPPLAKQTFSTFTGNATRLDKSEDAKLYASVDVYVSDFGEIQAIPSRWQRTRDVFVFESAKWAIAYLRPFSTIDIAATGDAIKKQLVVEYALQASAPKANGAVFDIT